MRTNILSRSALLVVITIALAGCTPGLFQWDVSHPTYAELEEGPVNFNPPYKDGQRPPTGDDDDDGLIPGPGPGIPVDPPDDGDNDPPDEGNDPNDPVTPVDPVDPNPPIEPPVDPGPPADDGDDDEECKPGWGHGSPHKHCGPPGLKKKRP